MDRRAEIWKRLDDIRAKLESYADAAAFGCGLLGPDAQVDTDQLNKERADLWHELMTTQNYNLQALQIMIEESRYRLAGGGVREKRIMDESGHDMVVRVKNKQVWAARLYKP